MTTPAAIRRITDLTVTFDRLGPVATGRARPISAPPLTVKIPPHTAKNVDATVGYLTTYVRQYVRMHLNMDTFTVSIDLSAGGNGTVLVDGGRHGRGTIANRAA